MVPRCARSRTRSRNEGVRGHQSSLRGFSVLLLPPESELMGHPGAEASSGRPFLVDGLAPGREVAFIAASGAWRSSLLERRLPVLVSELDRSFPNWGVCGNSGLLPDCRTTVRALQGRTEAGAASDGRAETGPCRRQRCSARRCFRLAPTRRRLAHCLRRMHWGATVSVACLRVGLLPVVDDRLFTLHPTD